MLKLPLVLIGPKRCLSAFARCDVIKTHQTCGTVGMLFPQCYFLCAKLLCAWALKDEGSECTCLDTRQQASVPVPSAPEIQSHTYLHTLVTLRLTGSSRFWRRCIVIAVSSFQGTQLGGCLPPSPEGGNRPSLRNLVFSSFYNTGRSTKSKNPIILNLIPSASRLRMHLFPSSIMGVCPWSNWVKLQWKLGGGGGGGPHQG
jgi:hypothetical protein